MPMGNMQLEAKNLDIISDQLHHEMLAYKKAEQYAQTFADPALRGLASTVSQHHFQRFNTLFQYLNSHQ